MKKFNIHDKDDDKLREDDLTAPYLFVIRALLEYFEHSNIDNQCQLATGRASLLERRDSFYRLEFLLRAVNNHGHSAKGISLVRSAAPTDV